MEVDLEAKVVVVAGTRTAQILVLVLGPKVPLIKSISFRPLELRLRPVLQKLSGVAKSREVGLVLKASGF